MKWQCIKFWILFSLFALQTQIFALDNWGYLNISFPFPQTQQDISTIPQDFAWILENNRAYGLGIYEDAVIITMPSSLNPQLRASDYQTIAKSLAQSAVNAQYIVFDITHLNASQLRAQKKVIYDLENYFLAQKKTLKFGFVLAYGADAPTNLEMLNLLTQNVKNISYLSINGDWVSFMNNISREHKNIEMNKSIDFLDVSGIEVIDANVKAFTDYLSAFQNLHALNLSSVFLKNSGVSISSGIKNKVLSQVANVLKKFNDMSYLNLSSNALDSSAAIIVSDIVGRFKDLVYINLSKNNFIGDDVNLVFNKLAEKRNLTYLNVASNALSERNADSFAKIIQNNTSLNFIDISFNYFSSDGYHKINLAQQVSRNLQVHKIRANHILYENFPDSAKMSHHYPELFYFDFGDNNFYFSHSNSKPWDISFPKTLQYLYLDSEGLNAKKLPDLVNSLINAKQLLGINISNNDIDGDGGIDSVVNLLKNSTHLIRIDLHKNNFTPKEMLQISQVLSLLPEIKYLDLSNNQMDNQSVSVLSKHFSQERHVRQLRMANVELSNADAIVLASGLKSQTQLSVLDVSFNDIEKSGLKKLLDVLATKTKFTTLIISGNRVDCRDVYDLIENPKFQCQ